MTKIFDRTGDFEAFRDAESWLKENGYSWGSMQGDAPIGVMRGDYDIAKWRNLSTREINALDGTITGDKRNGPVTVTIFKATRP